MNTYAAAAGKGKYIIFDLRIFWVLKHSQNSFWIQFDNRAIS